MGNGTNIGRVRGLGSAGHGAHHWIVQRITAIGNLILIAWLMTSLLRLPNYEYELMVEWLGSPLVAVPMMLLLVSMFWHLRLGLQVLFEDYVPDHGTRFGIMMFLNFFAIGGAALGIFAVARIAFAGVVE